MIIVGMTTNYYKDKICISTTMISLRALESPSLVFKAARGAANGPARLHEVPYLERISRERVVVGNPSHDELRQKLGERILSTVATTHATRAELLTLPWVENKREARITPARTFASLVAFTDDQGKTVAREFFPPTQIHQFLGKIEAAAQAKEGPLTVLDQFDIALGMTKSNPIAAALLAHSSYRAVARNADTKADESFSFSPDRMVSVARATADFQQPGSFKTDPLGDTYHFWSQFSAQTIFTFLRDRHVIQAPIYSALFRHGPELQKKIRAGWHRRKMSAGFHETVDLLGWELGTEMGRLLRDQSQQYSLRRSKRLGVI